MTGRRRTAAKATPNLVEIPEGAVVVYPTELIQQKFGHLNSGSTRKEMSRHGHARVSGYEAAAVDEIIANMDPRLAGWNRRGPKPKGGKT